MEGENMNAGERMRAVRMIEKWKKMWATVRNWG